MKLNVTVDEKVCVVDLPPDFLSDAESFFQKMDRDMDRGWQMGPEFIEHPDHLQRCQIAANKLLTSLSGANQNMIKLMSGYILKHLPNVTGVRIDTGGEMLHTEFTFDHESGRHDVTSPSPISRHAATVEKMSKLEAMEQAGKDVTKVYQVGKSFRFATRAAGTGEWVESPPLENEGDAHAQRMLAYKRRLDELTGQ